MKKSVGSLQHTFKTMETNNRIKGIIFDYGGTLDSRGDHWSEVIWDAYKKVGVDVTKEQFRVAYVYAERELARTLHILPHHNFFDLLLIKMQIELQNLAESGLFAPADVESKAAGIAKLCYDAAHKCVDDAKPVLDKLKERYPLVLVSNFYGNIGAVLEDFGLSGYFVKVIESAVVGVRKPDPRIFQLGVDALGLKPEEVLVIGDSFRKDILPARSLGCEVLWLKGKGWTPEEDAQTDESEIRSLDDVLSFLEK